MDTKEVIIIFYFSVLKFLHNKRVFFFLKNERETHTKKKKSTNVDKDMKAGSYSSD